MEAGGGSLAAHLLIGEKRHEEDSPVAAPSYSKNIPPQARSRQISQGGLL